MVYNLMNHSRHCYLDHSHWRGIRLLMITMLWLLTFPLLSSRLSFRCHDRCHWLFVCGQLTFCPSSAIDNARSLSELTVWRVVESSARVHFVFQQGKHSSLPEIRRTRIIISTDEDDMKMGEWYSRKRDKRNFRLRQGNRELIPPVRGRLTKALQCPVRYYNYL